MKIAIAQINTTIGDFAGNCAKITDGIKRAEMEGARIVIFPELSVCGYPPRDLLEKPEFLRKSIESLNEIARHTKKVAAVVGSIAKNENSEGKGLFNSSFLIDQGKIVLVQHKTLLPEYDVFDEARYFEPASKYATAAIDGINIGLSMCEDIWTMFEFRGRRLYRNDPIKKVVAAGADIVLNLSASPFTLGKHAIRRRLVTDAARRHGKPIIYCNLVGGNDELVFDGRSFVANGAGEIVCEAKGFEEDFLTIDLKKMQATTIVEKLPDEENIRRALVLGLRDYMQKCGFERVVIGLSGGIDSAVVAAVASEAIGPGRVMGVMMPSPYSSSHSITDSQKLAKNLGIITCKVPIDEIYAAYQKTLGFIDLSNVTLAEENIQARIRGNLLMAISNREGALVLSTGNKSELSVGYCTLYGDMAGGFALISDLPKTTVFALARHLNKPKEIIPESIISKPPSAELKPNQTDQDSLPPYDILDSIIRAYVEERKSAGEIAGMGIDKKIVDKICYLIDRNEYKRRQAAPGIKITSKAFGLGRRFPIAWKS